MLTRISVTATGGEDFTNSPEKSDAKGGGITRQAGKLILTFGAIENVFVNFVFHVYTASA